MVQLAFIDASAPLIDLYSSKLGGYAIWPSKNHPKSSCECGEYMALVFQAYCPIKDDFDRFLYAFCCLDCVKFKVFRVKKANKTISSSVPPVKSTGCNFSFDPSASDDELEKAMESLSIKKDLSSHVQGEQEEECFFEQSYSCQFHVKPLYVCEEELKLVSKSNSNNYKVECDSKGLKAECYEDARPKHFSKLFEKFHSRISQNPSQILRYDLQGIPLNTQIIPSIPACPCGSKRIFEMQLIGTAIYFLKGLDTDKLDFSTILIYTCKNDCDLHSEEVAIVQKE